MKYYDISRLDIDKEKDRRELVELIEKHIDDKNLAQLLRIKLKLEYSGYSYSAESKSIDTFELIIEKFLVYYDLLFNQIDSTTTKQLKASLEESIFDYI